VTHVSSEKNRYEREFISIVESGKEFPAESESQPVRLVTREKEERYCM